MEPRVERLYRETANEMRDTLNGLIAKYRDRNTDPEAQKAGLEGFRIKFASHLRRMNELARLPHKFWDELSTEEQAQGPLEDRMADVTISTMDETVDSGARTLLHTDVPEVAEHYARVISERYSMKKVACCLGNRIDVYKNGSVVKTYRRRVYTDAEGREYSAGEWKTYALTVEIQNDPSVMAAVLTATYAVGQNLQAFSETIMLDRDSWNAEVMTQRRGRNWRQGQSNAVSEVTFDVVYNEVMDEFDATLDELRRAMQEMEEELFDSVVIESQTEALGKEVREMDWISSFFTGLNRRLIEMTVAPNAARVGEAQNEGAA
jgi:hypothetical protein